METDFDLLLQALRDELEPLTLELDECLSENDYRYAQYYQKGIWLAKAKIKQVLALKDERFRLDSQSITDAINELNENKLASFSLFLDQDTGFYIHFHALPGKRLLCELPYLSALEYKYHYRPFSEIRLQLLSQGFDVSSERPQLEFTVPDDGSCEEILRKLSILMIDVLRVNPKATGYLSKKLY